jgi:hypothetical protein
LVEAQGAGGSIPPVTTKLKIRNHEV